LFRKYQLIAQVGSSVRKAIHSNDLPACRGASRFSRMA
jgi:hypothetical protein